MILSENWKLCIHNRRLLSHPLPRYQKSGRLVGWASELWSLEPFNYGTRLITGQSQTHAQLSLSVRLSVGRTLLFAFVILPPRFLLPLYIPTSNTPVLPPSHSWIFQQERTVIKFWLLLTCYKISLRQTYNKRGLSERICELPEFEETLKSPYISRAELTVFRLKLFSDHGQLICLALHIVCGRFLNVQAFPCPAPDDTHSFDTYFRRMSSSFRSSLSPLAAQSAVAVDPPRLLRCYLTLAGQRKCGQFVGVKPTSSPLLFNILYTRSPCLAQPHIYSLEWMLRECWLSRNG